MLSVVIPAFNEQDTIQKALEEIIVYFGRQAVEIIVVDDGCTDRTPFLVDDFKDKRVRRVRQPRNMGKGAAVRRGMLEAHGQHILFLDADMSTPIKELANCRKVKADVVVGSRALKDSVISVHQPFYRELLGKTFNKIVQVLAVPGVWDTQCGFKLFSQRAAKEIFSRSFIDGFGFDVEALFLARKLGFS
ncbi:MAG: glycosyltransferase family 2 protein, partial [Candidatus Woesearchaeota archaeon]|nr:glycosyltransferase family 2 protein [Candidatus Woesearchaeota archaeon]